MMRASGILMPITSLSSKYGIGTMGDAAYRFVDFLVQSGQKYWQILPIGPTGYGDSPYQSFSAFAANPYLIDLDILVGKGLLYHHEIENIDFGDTVQTKVNYAQIYNVRFNVLQLAVNRISVADDTFANFCAKNAFWLDDYSLFMAIKEKYDMVGLKHWPDELRVRDKNALAAARCQLESRIFFWKALQYLFYDQWYTLKKYANERGVEIIGDIPIYVSPDSSDLWAKPELFQLKEDKSMAEVAGCPPDGFSAEGQLWGNPLYAWGYHRQTGYEWWIKRLCHATEVYDVVRIDHFRGFESYYAIPAQDENAINGHWCKGPGVDFIQCIKEKLPNAKIIAEDLGFLTQDVYALLQASGFPGMKVLQFAFDSREESDYLPHNYIKNSVVYTGTHDNTTTADWVNTMDLHDLQFAKDYLNIAENQDVVDVLIRTAMSSVCNTAVIPIADWLSLGAEARINTPSTLGGNWEWRICPEQLDYLLAKRIYTYTKMYGRTPKNNIN